MSNDKISGLVALLDFYSNRATAQASYFVAFIFGLFTVLGIASGKENLQEWLYFAVSWLVWFSGLYCLLNFRFFAELAALTKGAIVSEKLPFQIKEFDGKKVKDLDVFHIDEGFQKLMVLEWKLGLVTRLFIRLKVGGTKYKELSKKDEIWNKKKKDYVTKKRFQIVNFYYILYLLIFALTSTAVFGLSLQPSLTCEFLNLLLVAIITFVLVVLDASKIGEYF